MLRRLSSVFPELVFILVTMCLDDGSIDSYLTRRGRGRCYHLSQRRQVEQWHRAMSKHGVEGDEAYENDDVRASAEAGMFADAERHWEAQLAKIVGARSSQRPTPRMQWRRTECLPDGHGYEFIHRRFGTVAFVKGYPCLSGQPDDVRVNVLALPPEGVTQRQWQSVIRETRQAITTIFTKNAKGLVSVLHSRRVGEIKLAING